MNTIDESSRLVRNAEIPTGVIDGELVALDLARGDCFGMDKVGTVIWTLICEPIQVATIIDRLVEDYHVDRESCANDVLPFLGELAEAGLVRVLEE
jgi:hypothetical protein